MSANLRLWVFILVFALFVTQFGYVHLSCPLIDSYECLSSCLFERLCFHLRICMWPAVLSVFVCDLQFSAFILSVNCKFFVHLRLWSRFSVLRLLVDLWLSLLQGYFRERPTVCAFSSVTVRFRFLVYFCLWIESSAPIISVQDLRFACSRASCGRDFQFCKLIFISKLQIFLFIFVSVF